MVTRPNEATRLIRCIANKGIFNLCIQKERGGMEEEKGERGKKEQREEERKK